MTCDHNPPPSAAIIYSDKALDADAIASGLKPGEGVVYCGQVFYRDRAGGVTIVNLEMLAARMKDAKP